MLSSIDDILADARAGRAFILVDDEARENEGDLIIPAQMATSDAINFMAKYGRGLICLALSKHRADELRLELMPRSNSSRFDTAFTYSIEAADGIDTGISAFDRAHTIAVAIDPAKSARDIATPGHVFPLVARDGGVLVRAGHTEAAVDIARLAGLYPAGVICEIMKDDGTMARLPDLLEFAQIHNLKVATIADLISYRLAREKLVEKVSVTDFSSSQLGNCKMHVYRNIINGIEHIALVKGILSNAPLVRMHSFNILSDALGDDSGGRALMLDRALQAIAREGAGVCVILREPKHDFITAAANTSPDATKALRDYGIGAQILLDLGIHAMTLLTTTPKHIIALEGYGIEIREFKASW